MLWMNWGLLLCSSLALGVEPRVRLDLTGTWTWTPLGPYQPAVLVEDFATDFAGRWHPQSGRIPHTSTWVEREDGGHALRAEFGPYPPHLEGWAQVFRWASFSNGLGFDQVEVTLRRMGATPEDYAIPLYFEGQDDTGQAVKTTVPIPLGGTEWHTVTVDIASGQPPVARLSHVSKISFLVFGPLPQVTFEVAQLRLLARPREDRPVLDMDFDGPGGAPSEKLAPSGEAEAVVVPTSKPASRARYERTFTVPADWESRIVTLHCEAVNFACEVRCNGVVVGHHVGLTLPFEMDLTPHVRWGEENTLTFDVAGPDWATRPRPSEEVYEGGPDTDTPIVLYPLARNAQGQVGLRQPLWLEARPPVFIDAVRAIPSVRQETLTVEADVRNTTAQAAIVHLAATVLDGKRAVKELRSEPTSLPPHQTQRLAAAVPWPDAQLWSPDHPHLYTLCVRLEIGKSKLENRTGAVNSLAPISNFQLPTSNLQSPISGDEVALRFGFRELWTEGHHVFLNGVRTPLYGTSIDVATADRAYYEKHYRAFKRWGMNVVRLHGEPHEPLAYEVADEVGIMLVNESELYGSGGSRQYPYRSEAFFQAVAQGFADWVKRDFNHPSVVLYSVENECVAAWNHPNHEHINRFLARLGHHLKGLDPTRPIYYSADGDPGGTGAADLLCYHYPGQDHAPLEMQGELVEGRRERPVMIGEYGFLDQSKGSQARWVGEAGFHDARAHIDVFARFYHETLPAFRRSGVECLLPFSWRTACAEFGNVDSPPTKVAETFRRCFAPLVVSVLDAPAQVEGEPDRIPGGPGDVGYALTRHATKCQHYLAGTPVRKVAWVCSDLHERAKVKVRWKTKLGGGGDADGGDGDAALLHARPSPVTRHPSLVTLSRFHGETSLTVEPNGGVAGVPIELAAPSKPGEYLLTVEVWHQGRLASTETQTFTVYPPKFATEPAPAGRLLLYDPRGTTRAALARLGIDCPAIPAVSLAALAEADALVIGEGSLDDALAGQRQALADWVAAGKTVVVLMQEQDDALSPLRLKRSDYTVSYAWVHAPGHPVFDGLPAVELSHWSGLAAVSRGPFWKPTAGAFRALVGAHGHRWVGLGCTPLIEVFHGRGRYLLSQLTLVGHAANTPVAARLLRNLLTYAAGAEPVDLRPLAVLMDVGETTRGLLERAELEAAEVSPEALDTLSANTLLIVPAEYDLARLAAQREAFLAFMRAGGRVLALRQNPEAWRDDWLPAPVQLVPYPSQTNFRVEGFPPWAEGPQDALARARAVPPAPPPLLAGIPLTDICANDLWDREKIYVEAAFESWGEGWEPLLVAGAKLADVKEEFVANWFRTHGDDRHATLLRTRYGNGEILLCQVHLEAPPGRWVGPVDHLQRAFATLITNLRCERSLRSTEPGAQSTA